MSTNIDANDQRFFQRVLGDSVQCGFIDKPTKHSEWLGHDVRYYRESHVSHSSSCFFFLGSGGRDDKTGLFLALIAFAAAFFTGLIYTAASFESATRAQHDLRTARAGANPPPCNPDLYPSLQPIDSELQGRFSDATFLLERRRQERMFAACAQGLMTAGAGLLTIAILVALVTEPQFWTVTSAVTGGSAVAFGALLFFAKLVQYDDRDYEQRAAQRISDYLESHQRLS